MCSELFKLLSDMDLETSQLHRSDIQVNSKAADNNMRELVTHSVTDSAELINQQYHVIPTNKILLKYRDLLREAIRSQKHKDDTFKE